MNSRHIGTSWEKREVLHASPPLPERPGELRPAPAGTAPRTPTGVLTIVDKDKSSEEIETCRQIAAELGVKLRIRSFIDS